MIRRMAGNKFQRYKPAARHKTTSINRHLSRRPGKEDINLQYGENFGQLIFPKAWAIKYSYETYGETMEKPWDFLPKSKLRATCPGFENFFVFFWIIFKFSFEFFSHFV